MILDRFSIFRALFPERRRAADAAARWQRAYVRDNALAGDVIELGRVLALRPVLFDQGVEVPEPIDPVRLAYDQGRRDMAVQIIALMGVNNTELAQLMEVENAD